MIQKKRDNHCRINLLICWTLRKWVNQLVPWVQKRQWLDKQPHHPFQPQTGMITRALFQYEYRLSRYGDSRDKDKAEVRLSYPYHEDSCTGNAAFWYLNHEPDVPYYSEGRIGYFNHWQYVRGLFEVWCHWLLSDTSVSVYSVWFSIYTHIEETCPPFRYILIIYRTSHTKKPSLVK